MMPFVLLVMFLAPTPRIEHIEFANEAACKAAQADLDRDLFILAEKSHVAWASECEAKAIRGQ